MENQEQQVLYHLRKIGPITAIDALRQYGCFRLAARIKNLRDAGHHIETTRININDKIIAQYSLIGEAK